MWFFLYLFWQNFRNLFIFNDCSNIFVDYNHFHRHPFVFNVPKISPKVNSLISMFSIQRLITKRPVFRFLHSQPKEEKSNAIKYELVTGSEPTSSVCKHTQPSSIAMKTLQYQQQDSTVKVSFIKSIFNVKSVFPQSFKKQQRLQIHQANTSMALLIILASGCIFGIEGSDEKKESQESLSTLPAILLEEIVIPDNVELECRLSAFFNNNYSMEKIGKKVVRRMAGKTMTILSMIMELDDILSNKNCDEATKYDRMFKASSMSLSLAYLFCTREQNFKIWSIYNDKHDVKFNTATTPMGDLDMEEVNENFHAYVSGRECMRRDFYLQALGPRIANMIDDHLLLRTDHANSFYAQCLADKEEEGKSKNILYYFGRLANLAQETLPFHNYVPAVISVLENPSYPSSVWQKRRLFIVLSKYVDLRNLDPDLRALELAIDYCIENNKSDLDAKEATIVGLSTIKKYLVGSKFEVGKKNFVANADSSIAYEFTPKYLSRGQTVFGVKRLADDTTWTIGDNL